MTRLSFKYSYPAFSSISVICVSLFSAMAFGQALSTGCLYAVTVGSDDVPVQPCLAEDPLSLATDQSIEVIVKAFRLSDLNIQFNGCNSIGFSASHYLPLGKSIEQYVITYPTDSVDSYVGPLIHELAHLLQMKSTGGISNLRASMNSIRIELGADFLTGLAFANYLSELHINNFHHSTNLYGLYEELDINAHGSPSQRSAAFLYGVNFDFKLVDKDPILASQYFQDELYGKIIQF